MLNTPLLKRSRARSPLHTERAARAGRAAADRVTRHKLHRLHDAILRAVLGVARLSVEQLPAFGNIC